MRLARQRFMTGPLQCESRIVGGRRLSAWRAAAREARADNTLLCLHPLPFSGAFFAAAAPFLHQRRRLLCPDYPGFGGSDPLPDDWSIERWAAYVSEALEAFGVDGQVDLLGFHTGCLVGPALAHAHPERVRRLVLVDVPYFDAEQRADLADQTANAARYVGKPIAIRGFRTAFAFNPIPVFKRLEHATLIIGTDSSLHGPSEAAARAMPGARFLGRPDISAPVFESGAERIAECVDKFLDETDRAPD